MMCKKCGKDAEFWFVSTGGYVVCDLCRGFLVRSSSTTASDEEC